MTAEYRRAYALKYPEKVIAWNKKYRSNHQKQSNQYRKQWASNNKERIKGYIMKYTYGLSKQVYDAMVKDQKSQCLICGLLQPLVIDHDHKTGKVRGLLCHQCNMVLGYCKENLLVLKNAITYIQKANNGF